MAILNVFNSAGELGSGLVSTAAGRFDSQYVSECVEFNVGQGGPVPIPSGYSDLWIHFDNYSDSAANNNNSDGYIWTITTDHDDRAWQLSVSNGNWQIQSWNGTSWINQGVSVGPPNDEIIATIDIHIEINNAGDDILNIYSGGAIYLTHTVANAGATTISSFVFAHNDTGDEYYYSQFIIADESTIGMKLTPLTPESDAADTAWTGDFASVVDRNDGLAAFSDTAGERESYNLTDYIGPASPSGIRSIVMASRAAIGSSGPTGFNHFLKIGGTNYDGANHANPNGIDINITEWTTNPSNSNPWSSSDLDALIAGIRSNA